MYKYRSVVAVFAIACFSKLASGAYENNPFLTAGNVPSTNSHQSSIKPKQTINQLNLAVVLPQNGQIPIQPLNGQTPSPAAPGYVWVQVPVSQPDPVYVPAIQQPTFKPPKEPITVRPPDAVPPSDGWVTIEPPEILYGGSLNAKCLKPTGQFPSTACNKYVNCWNGVAIEQSCGEGLVFNPKGYCDYPANVDCDGKPIDNTQPPVTVSGDVTGTTPSYSEKPVDPTQPPSYIPTQPTSSPTLAPVDPDLLKRCLKPRGQFPSKSCNKYVNCWDGVAIEQDCPEGLLFSVKGYCDYPANVNCDKRAPPRTSETTTSQDKECPLEYGTFRQQNNCTTYYTCIAFKVVARHDCPEGFLFNDNIGVCDYAYRVDCGKEPILTRTANVPYVTNVVNPNVQCLQDFGTFRDKNNCGKYFTCLSRQVVASYECPTGFSFNDNLGVCDHSENVDCTKEPTVYMKQHNYIPVIPPEFKDKIDGCKPGVVFRLNQNCSLACLCREGLAEFIQCPEGLSYDSVTDKCLPPHLARCENVVQTIPVID